MGRSAEVFIVHEDCLTCEDGGCVKGNIGGSPFFTCGDNSGRIWWPEGAEGPSNPLADGLTLQTEPPPICQGKQTKRD